MFSIEMLCGKQHQYMYQLMQEHGDCFIIWNKYVTLNNVKAIHDILEMHNLDKALSVQTGYKCLFSKKGVILADSHLLALLLH